MLPAIETYRKLGVAIVGQMVDAAEALAGLGRPAEGRELLDRAARDASAMMRLPCANAARRFRNNTRLMSLPEWISGGASIEGGP